MEELGPDIALEVLEHFPKQNRCIRLHKITNIVQSDVKYKEIKAQLDGAVWGFDGKQHPDVIDLKDNKYDAVIVKMPDRKGQL